MAFYNSEDIRNVLAPMERGKGIAHFNSVVVTFNPNGYFCIHKNNRLLQITQSLAKAVKYTRIALD